MAMEPVAVRPDGYGAAALRGGDGGLRQFAPLGSGNWRPHQTRQMRLLMRIAMGLEQGCVGRIRARMGTLPVHIS